MIPIWVTTAQEKNLLEQCLTEAHRRLKIYRDAGDDLLIALTEADIDRILDELGGIYRRVKGAAHR